MIGTTVKRTLCSVEDRAVMETSLHCCQDGEDQALDEHGQPLLVFRQEMNDPSTKLRRLGMGDDHSAVDDAVLIKLTLDTDLLIQRERHVRGEMQSLFRDVRDLTEGRGLIQDY